MLYHYLTDGTVRIRSFTANLRRISGPHSAVISNLVKAIKIIEVAWNIKKNKAHANNEPYIDVVIIHHQQDDYYLLVRQCVNIVGAGTKHKFSVGCGALSYKLNTLMNSKESPLTGGEFYIKKKLLKILKTVKFFSIICVHFTISNKYILIEADVMIINKSIKRFINPTIRLGAQQHTDDQ